MSATCEEDLQAWQAAFTDHLAFVRQLESLDVDRVGCVFAAE